MMDAILQGGFTDHSRQSALAFRATLDALARPGSLHNVAGAEPPDGLSAAAGVLLLTLADAETPLWLPERMRGGAAEWLLFHTNAPQVVERKRAAFAVGRWDELMPLEDWPAGEPAYPDCSATLIIEAAALDAGAALELSGPGIDGRARLAPVLPDGAAVALALNAARFPLGLDFFFTSGGQVAGLPRSTRVARWTGG